MNEKTLIHKNKTVSVITPRRIATIPVTDKIVKLNIITPKVIHPRTINIIKVFDCQSKKKDNL